MNLTIRQKTWLSIILTLFSLIVVLYFVLSNILMNEFAHVEQTDTSDDVSRVTDALSGEISKLDLIVQDWANWDDSYSFIDDHNQDYINANLNDLTLIRLNLRFIAYYNTDNQLVFGRTIDWQNSTVSTLPAGFDSYAVPNKLLPSQPSVDSKKTGLMLLPEGALFFVARPILDSNGDGPSHGTLIMARSLNSAEVTTLADLTHFSLSIQNFNQTDLPIDFSRAKTVLATGKDIYIQPLDENSVAGYTLLKDFTGNPALILKVATDRPYYQQGLQSLHYVIISLLLACLTFGAVTLLLLERSVLSRLSNLTMMVKSITISRDSKQRLILPGSDEVARLANHLNQMIDALDYSEKQQYQSEERYRQLVELSPEAILVQHSGKLVFVNKAGAKLFGANTPEDLLGYDVKSFFPNVDFTDSASWIMKAGDQIQSNDQELRRLDDQIVIVDVWAAYIDYADQPATQLIIRDISERKQVALLESDRRQVLEMIVANQPLDKIMLELTHLVEHQRPNSRCSITLLSSQSFGDSGGYSSWSVPIFSGSMQMLGSINLFYANSSHPRHADTELLELACKIAAIAIEQKVLTKQLAHQAHYDALTGLPNRLLFENRLKQALMQANDSKLKAALLFLDLDRFKIINDTLGHQVGDELLRQVAKRLRSCLRSNDMVARMGGDEFTVILSDVKNTKAAELVAQKIIRVLDEPFIIEKQELNVSSSIGISYYPDDGEDIYELLRKADSAMYRAKGEGRGSYQFYFNDTNKTTLQRLKIESLLRHALANHELELYYQPQFEAKSGQLIGVESLLRWNSAELGQVSPSAFIRIAEETNLILPIGAWVLKEACRQNRAWQAAGLEPFKVAVNVSALQLQAPNFVDTVACALEDSGLAAEWLEIELTENMLMSRADETSQQLERLRQLGVSIAIDDFGTGYSSLSYLQRLPIDCIKIDQSFVQNIGSQSSRESYDGAIIKAIAELAHSLKMKVIVEGVETAQQLLLLEQLGCDCFQGYYFMRPVSAPAFEEKLRVRNETLLELL